MSEKDKAKEKRDLIWTAIQSLSDEEVLANETFTYWGRPDDGKPGAVTYHHGGSHPPDPPPPPPDNGK